MGYLLVSAVLVVTLGRFGDMLGWVRIYNLGFLVFSIAAVLLSVDPFHGQTGALWLIVRRGVQGVGGAMLMADSTAILTDAFGPNERGMALGINQVAALAGSFIGLVAGGLLSQWNWRAVFLVSVPIGIAGTIWSYASLKEAAVGFGRDREAAGRQGGRADRPVVLPPADLRPLPVRARRGLHRAVLMTVIDAAASLGRGKRYVHTDEAPESQAPEVATATARLRISRLFTAPVT